ncbi:MAG: DeoR family transcriptional regulator [Deltaproteobacteria bacterium]|nr:DeoR family transcriptional regulator [Deltaproteobacteria bacterium]MBW2642696.1 DeoR family transcriptional regulator [Deltaproteobacteria bacterium]
MVSCLPSKTKQIKAVLFVKEREKITNKNIQALFKVSRETATRDLIFLLEKDILLSFGSNGAGALQSV